MKTKEKLMIFIDGRNIVKGSNKEGIKVSYSKLINFLSKDFNLIRTYYYTGIPHLKIWNPKKQTKKDFLDMLGKQVGFLKGLEHNQNIHVTTKDLISAKGKWHEKGVDVNIACDILWHGLNNNYDVFILLSGDKDFADVLSRMKDNGKKVIVANFKRSISKEMKRLCDKYINLNQYKSEIEN